MNIVRICVALLFVITIASCKKENFVHAGDYNRSFSKWAAFQDSSHNSYRYTVAGGSWTGSGWNTEITVKNGTVVKRSFVYKAYATPNATTVTVVEQWEEDQTQLGTHERGAALWTLDRVYLEARNNWLLKRDKAKVYFEANNNGMISSAGYVPDGCQDDCFTGISITSIKPL